jgi:hypothetical protein
MKIVVTCSLLVDVSIRNDILTMKNARNPSSVLLMSI